MGSVIVCIISVRISGSSQRRNNTVILVSDSGLISVLGPTDLIAALNTLHGTEPLTLCPMKPATGEEKDVLSTFNCRM